MNEFVGHVFDIVKTIISEYPVIRLVLGLWISCVAISTLFKCLCGCGLGAPLVNWSDAAEWIRRNIVRFLFKAFGPAVVMRTGLAREGVDFVNCDLQECISCPFADKCEKEEKCGE